MPAYLCKIPHTSGIAGKNHRLYGAEKSRTKATASRKPRNSLKPRRQSAPEQQAKGARPAGRAASHSENAAFCAHLIAWCIARRFCRFTPAGPPHFLRHAKSRPAQKTGRAAKVFKAFIILCIRRLRCIRWVRGRFPCRWSSFCCPAPPPAAAG